MSLGPSEVLVVLLVALVVLGPDKLPQAARSLGKLIGEFRKLSSAVQSQVDDVLKIPADNEPEKAEERPTNPDIAGFTLIDEKNDPPPVTPPTKPEADS